jgi:hypothetical protein
LQAPKTLYAHVAIPKTASTTLVHVLRRNFFMRCLEVRPLFPSSRGVFCARDLCVSLRINPAIECITGHAIHAYSDLGTVVDDVKYFTTLRDPVERCVSAYLYGIEVRDRKFTFEQHLDTEGKENIQTKWIAGEPDLEAAKQILADRFWLVGRTERLAELILMLGKELAERRFHPLYQSKNLRAARTDSRKEMTQAIFDRYRDEIVTRNQLDIDLIEHVDTQILPRQRARYGPGLEDDVKTLKASAIRERPPRLNPYLDYVVRKAYYDPVIGLLRKWNGLSYAERI